MKAKSLILAIVVLIISLSIVSGNTSNFYNTSIVSENQIVHIDIKDNDIVYFTQNGNVYRADMNSNKSILLDSLGSKITQIVSSGNMMSIRTQDKKIYVFNHDKRIIYKFVPHLGDTKRAIIDDKGYLAVITLKDISSPEREWIAYVYSPSGDLISQKVSNFDLTSFASLNDKLVFGEANGDVSIYDQSLNLLWKNNLGRWLKKFQHYKDNILIPAEKSVYILSYNQEPKLSKILSLEGNPELIANDDSRLAIASTEGCLYLMDNDSLQNQFSFNGKDILKGCYKKDKILGAYILGDKTLVLTNKGKIFVIQGDEKKLVINKNVQNINNSDVGGYLDKNGKLNIVFLNDYWLDFYSFENILNLEKELSDAKRDYQSFLKKTKEENIPTFEGEPLLKTIDNNYKMALSYWETGEYSKSKDSLDKFKSGVREYLGSMEAKSTNIFSIILVAAVLILAVIGIVLSRRKKSIECSNCGYILKDYWSHCPKCGEPKGGR
ncbi:MAG: hypothetical protein BWX72_00214 [Firmicutes bacterium ADurb.Bin080]|jgi:hypothetical protein|nr:MAG: hypothetical protein BWX72_00214 [Firmicutes bacterium ADurb.Bin080]